MLKLATRKSAKVFDKNSIQVLVSSVSEIWKSKEPGRHATGSLCFLMLLLFGKGYCALSVMYSILKNPVLLNLDATTSKRVLVRSRVLHIDRSEKDDGSIETENKSTNASVSTIVVTHKLEFGCFLGGSSLLGTLGKKWVAACRF